MNRAESRTKLWKPNGDSRICSVHFENNHPFPILHMGHTNIPKDYALQSRRTIKRHCTDTVNPTVDTQDNCTTEEHHLESSTCTSELINVTSTSNNDPRDAMFFHSYDGTEWEDYDCNRCLSKNEQLVKMWAEIKKLKCPTNVNLTHVNSKAKIDISDKMLQSSKLFRIYTGMDRITFDTIYSVVSEKANTMKYWHGPRYAVNVANRRYFKPGPQRKMSRKNEFLMTMMKLKTGLHMAILGSLFGVSESQVSRIVTTWFKFLSKAIGSLVYNPDKGAVMQCRPKAFEDRHYRDVRHIIDATEVFIETPKSLKLAAACYSDYKHHHTVKYLVSINPNGHISFSLFV